MTLSPAQKKILMVGVPIVLVLGIYTLLKGRSSSSASTAATGSTTAASGSAPASNAPIGLDQLTSFESQVTAQLGQLGQAVAAVQQAQTNSPPPASTSTGLQPGGPAMLGQPAPFNPPALAPPTSTGTTTPTVAPAPSNPFSHISDPNAAGVDAAAGITEYGMTQPGVYVPVVQNGQWTAAGQAYRQHPNAGLFLNTGAMA